MADASTAPNAKAGISKSRAGGVLAASLASAVAAFAISIIAANTLATSDYAEFLVYWSLLFGLYGVVGGLQGESTRASGAAFLAGAPRSGARIMLGGLLLSLGTGLLLIISSPIWGHRLVPSTLPGVVPLIAIGVVVFGCFQALLGTSAGLSQWNQFSTFVALDGVGRLVLVAVAAMFAGSLWSIEVSGAVSTLSVFLVASLLKSGRRALAASADVNLGSLLVKSLLTMISGTATAIVIVGFSVLVQLTSANANPRILSGTLTAVQLTRSPILIPVQAFQGVAIAAFLRAGNRALRALIKPVLAVLGLCAVGAPIAAWLGPWLLDVLYAGLRFEHDALTFAGLLFAAAPLAILSLTGTAVIALDRHRAFTLGWIAAAAGVILLLLLPGSLQARVIISLIGGPLIGIGIHLWALRNATSSNTTKDAD